MLSVGPQELAAVGVLLLLLLVLGSSRFSSTASDVVHVLGGARRTVEEVKSELIPEEVEEARHDIRDLKKEALYGAGQDKHRSKAKA